MLINNQTNRVQTSVSITHFLVQLENAFQKRIDSQIFDTFLTTFRVLSEKLQRIEKKTSEFRRIIVSEKKISSFKDDLEKKV